MSKGGRERAENTEPDEMRPEYDFSNAERGKFYHEALEHVNVVLLEPDVAGAFPDSDSVNRALRLLIEVARNEAGAKVLADRKEPYRTE